MRSWPGALLVGRNLIEWSMSDGWHAFGGGESRCGDYNLCRVEICCRDWLLDTKFKVEIWLSVSSTILSASDESLTRSALSDKERIGWIRGGVRCNRNVLKNWSFTLLPASSRKLIRDVSVDCLWVLGLSTADDFGRFFNALCLLWEEGAVTGSQRHLGIILLLHYYFFKNSYQVIKFSWFISSHN